MKLTFRKPRPRNPIAAPARARHAGRHGRSEAGLRQQAKTALKRELDRLRAVH